MRLRPSGEEPNFCSSRLHGRLRSPGHQERTAGAVTHLEEGRTVVTNVRAVGDAAAERDTGPGDLEGAGKTGPFYR
jgi:hypothetical protein